MAASDDSGECAKLLAAHSVSALKIRNVFMSIQTVENILHEAERLTFGEQLTLIQRLLDGLRKTSTPATQTGELSAQQLLKQVLAKPARRKLKSLELDTTMTSAQALNEFCNVVINPFIEIGRI
jgi:hypothetical protein